MIGKIKPKICIAISTSPPYPLRINISLHTVRSNCSVVSIPIFLQSDAPIGCSIIDFIFTFKRTDTPLNVSRQTGVSTRFNIQKIIPHGVSGCSNNLPT